jgi:hypothetical protein
MQSRMTVGAVLKRGNDFPKCTRKQLVDQYWEKSQAVFSVRRYWERPGGNVSANDDDVSQIKGVNFRSREQVVSDGRTFLNENPLVTQMGNHTDSIPNTSAALSTSFETDEVDLNERQPTMTAIPFESTNREWTIASPSGTLFVMSVLDNIERVPVHGMGVSFTHDQHPSQGKEKGPPAEDQPERLGSVQAEIFGTDGENAPSVVSKEQMSSKVFADVPVGDESDITVQNTREYCIGLFAAVCAGVNAIGRRGCVLRCFQYAAATANPIVGGGCTTFCVALTSTYGQTACASTPFFVCQELGFC